jgi:hypothetical protein
MDLIRVTWQLRDALERLHGAVEPIADYESQNAGSPFAEGGDVAVAMDRAEEVLATPDEAWKQRTGQLHQALVEVIAQYDDSGDSAERSYWSGQAEGLRKAAKILGLDIEEALA